MTQRIIKIERECLMNQRKMLISMLKHIEDTLQIPDDKRAIITQKERVLFSHLKKRNKSTIM